MKRRRFLFFFMKSILQRKGRFIIAAVSVSLAVAVITCMLGITIGIREKLGAELKSYGANIIVSPLKGDYLEYDKVDSISSLKNVEEVSGQVFGSAKADNRNIEIIGLDMDKLKNRGWRLAGRWPDKRYEILAGINIRDALSLIPGQDLPLMHETKRTNFLVGGFIEKGGAEDSAIIMAIPDAWDMMGLEGKLSAILVRGRSGQLQGVVREIKGMLPAASVKTLRQVAVAEESLLGKIQLLMALVTVVVVFATSISVASTMGANVLERREEIGLMKALGAAKKEISIFYKTEAALIGFSGGLTGFILGYLSVQAVSKGAFNSFVTMPAYISVFSLSTGLLIAMLASYFPVRDAMKYNPAVILRGE